MVVTKVTGGKVGVVYRLFQSNLIRKDKKFSTGSSLT